MTKNTGGKKQLNKSLKENKIMEKNLITMALKRLKKAEQERRLNPAQKRRRQELKVKLRIVNEELKKFKEPEPLNTKDKRPLKEFHYKILKALKETPNITQRNIYIEDALIKKFDKSYLIDLVLWGYATRSDKNRYSITRQGKWRLRELANVVRENKRKAKLKEYKNRIRRLAQLKKELHIYKKKYDDIQERDRKLRASISKITEKEWDERRFDYKWKDIYDKETKTFKKFKWSNPKEAEILISFETGGSRHKVHRKAYNDYWDRVSAIKRYEKLIESDVLKLIKKDPKEIKKEVRDLEDKLREKRKERTWTTELYNKKQKDVNKLVERISILKEWIK